MKLQVVPGANRNQVTGLYGDRLKIRVAAPPAQGAANNALLAFLARCLEVPRSQLRLKSGDRNRAKVVEILNSGSELAARLQALAPER